MPFFITVSRNYKTQSTIGLATMLLSYAMILAVNGFGLSWVGIIFFLVRFWQMAELQFKTISLQPYKPPFLPWASEEIGMDKGTKKLNRMVHVSFWGDIYLFFIFISYILTFL